MSEPIKKDKVPALIVREILTRLRRGELRPGERLPPQRELAEHYGYGISSVREAINALIGMGYIEVVQGSGTFIAKSVPSKEPSSHELNTFLEAASIFDLMESRELLECKSAELAAERAEKSHIARIEQAVDRIKEDIDDISGFFKADMAFHLALAEASGNIVIAELTKILLSKVHKHHIHFRATSSLEVREHTYRTARQVLANIAAGHGREASACMHEHLRKVGSQLREVIVEIGPMLGGINKIVK